MNLKSVKVLTYQNGQIRLKLGQLMKVQTVLSDFNEQFYAIRDRMMDGESGDQTVT